MGGEPTGRELARAGLAPGGSSSLGPDLADSHASPYVVFSPKHATKSCNLPELNMSQAIMDPERVRRFAEELQRFNREVEGRMATLQARFAALGDTWQDQEQVKFADEFKVTMKALKRFVEIS